MASEGAATARAGAESCGVGIAGSAGATRLFAHAIIVIALLTHLENQLDRFMLSEAVGHGRADAHSCLELPTVEKPATTAVAPAAFTGAGAPAAFPFAFAFAACFVFAGAFLFAGTSCAAAAGALPNAFLDANS